MESLVAQRIKTVLESKQISIAAFSKMIGMQQVTCNRQIRGDQAVSLGLIEGFLKEFGEISAEWLLRGKGSQVIVEPSFFVAEEPKHDIIHEVMSKQDSHQDDSHQEDFVWKAKYEELEKRYDQLLSILGGGMRQANVG